MNNVLNHVRIERDEIRNELIWLVNHTEVENSRPDKVGEEGHIVAKTEVLATKFAMPNDEQYNQPDRVGKEQHKEY